MNTHMQAGLRLVVTAALAFGLAGAALAQEPVKKASNPFQGFSSDPNKPVEVDSEELEVRQEQQMAVFSGNVVARQGDSTLCAPKLIVYYDNAQTPGGKAAGTEGTQDDSAAGTPNKATAGVPQTGAIKKLEASGGVVVTSRDQVATGQNGMFDMTTNTAVLTEDVVLRQGPSLIRGGRLTVDLKTGVTRLTGDGGRTSSTFSRATTADEPKTIACTSLVKQAQ